MTIGYGEAFDLCYQPFHHDAKNNMGHSFQFASAVSHPGGGDAEAPPYATILQCQPFCLDPTEFLQNLQSSPT